MSSWISAKPANPLFYVATFTAGSTSFEKLISVPSRSYTKCVPKSYTKCVPIQYTLCVKIFPLQMRGNV